MNVSSTIWKNTEITCWKYIYIKWEAKVQHIPCAWAVSRPWGPTAEDVAGCLTAIHNPCVVAEEHPVDQSLDDYNSDCEDVRSEGDDELLMAIEEMALAEEYPIEEADEGEFTEDEEWLGGYWKWLFAFLTTSVTSKEMEILTVLNVYIV